MRDGGTAGGSDPGTRRGPARPGSAPRSRDDRDLSTGDYRSLARFRHALRVFLRFSEDAARERGLTP
ncbi:MAG TPA: hypothetical protein PLL32_03700, partial [Anaeromyxobacteraceae bacterium]|nr:hypothetical protein [Anaeromyxobacteraceae bacterium]